MKQAECSRCGEPMMVPDDFDPFEDMAVCEDCTAAFDMGRWPEE